MTGKEPPDPKVVSLKDAKRKRDARPVTGDWRDELILNENGGVARRLSNALLAFANHPDMRGRLARTTLGQCECWVTPPPWNPSANPHQVMSDEDITFAAAWLERDVGMPMSRDNVAAALSAVASQTIINPVQEYLRATVWDGVPRIARLLNYYFGVERNSYVDAISRMWPISAVARALDPGCQVDTVLVLEGAQGLKKSSSLRALFGREWTLDSLGEVGARDSEMQLSVAWCVELPELDHFTRADKNTIKRWITTAVDNYRAPWGRRPRAYRRPSIFVATHNPTALGWQDDPTGARRFWPVLCSAIDLDALHQDRDQIWAEAVAAYDVGEHWWFEEGDPTEALLQARAEQEDRQTSDPWTGPIVDYLGRVMLEHITMQDLMGALDIPKKEWSRSTETRIGTILTRTARWKRVRVTEKGERVYVYQRV